MAQPSRTCRNCTPARSAPSPATHLLAAGAFPRRKAPVDSVGLRIIRWHRCLSWHEADAAARHIADAKVHAINAETRFSSAYTAIRMLADVGLLIRLDKLRKQRNLTEYTGDLIPESAVAECLSQALSLHAATLNWLKAWWTVVRRPLIQVK